MEHLHTPIEIDDQDDDREEVKPARRRRTPAVAAPGRAKGTKAEERGERTTGRITRMMYGQSYGFIRIDDGREVFFHRKDARAGLFNQLDSRDRVVFELIDDPVAGPRAVRVARL